MTTTTASTPRAPFATILMAAAVLSLSACFLAFFGRLAQLDGDLNAAVQYAIGGLLTGPALMFLLFGFLLARETLWLIESLAQRDITGDALVGKPASPAPELTRFLPTFAPPQLPRYALAGSERSYTRADLQHLIHHVYSAARWSGRGTLRGMTLPSGEVLADYDQDVVPFLELLERHGLLVGRGPGVRGAVQGDESGALDALHLLH